jgi:hypothetical protein
MSEKGKSMKKKERKKMAGRRKREFKSDSARKKEWEKGAKKKSTKKFYILRICISTKQSRPPQNGWGRGGGRLVFCRQMYCTVFKVPVL